MKKKLLFITQYLHTGGIERSLLTLLSDINYEKYDVDLLLFDHTGVLFKYVPSQVNILPPLFETFSTPLPQAIPELLKKKKFKIIAGKILAASLSKFSKGIGTGIRWKVYRRILKKQSKHYDVAISYIDFFCNYYVTEKVNADKKIVYNHMDYEYSEKQGWPCPSLEKKSFSECTYIVSVAESSKNTLSTFYPEFTSKMKVLHNRVSAETIQSLALDTSNIKKLETANKIILVTLARLVDEKGVFTALETCQLLTNEGYKICWLLIGNGPLMEELKQKTKDVGLDNNLHLLGEIENPYPYIKMCDIYVQPSKTEAHCVAVEEALALNVPIVVTDIPAFKNQINDGETGIIVQGKAKGLAEGIKRIHESEELRLRLIENCKRREDTNKIEMEKFLKLLA